MHPKKFILIVFALLLGCSPLSGDGGGGAEVAPPAPAAAPGAAVDPAIVGTAPGAGAADAYTNKPIAVGFNTTLDTGSVSNQTLVVYKTADGPGSPLTGTVAYDKFTQSIVFSPAAILEEKTNYTATLANTVQTPSGGKLAAPYTWSFTTKDQTPPFVVSTIPANNAVNVDPYLPITIEFSEPLDPASLGMKANIDSLGSFYLSNQSFPNVGLPAKITYTAGGTQVLIEPTALLLPLTDYQLYIFGASDAAGNPMASVVIVNFKIKDYLYATLANPPIGSTSAPIDSSITVSFNHALNTATVSSATFTVSGGVTTSVPISFAAGDKLATFIPSANLLPFTNYVVSLASTIKDTLGNSLGKTVTFEFTTSGSVTSWGAATQIDTTLSPSDSTSYQLAQAGNGDTFAIWVKGSSVLASRMPSGGEWSAPAPLNLPSDGSLVSGAAIGADGSGNAMAAWIAGSSSAATTAYSLRFTPSAGWQSPASRQSLSSISFPVAAPVRIAMNSLGYALIVWRRYNASAASGSQFNIRGKGFFPNPTFLSGSFNNEQDAQGKQTLDADNVQVAIDGSDGFGNGWLAWTQKSPDSGKHLFVNQAGNGAWNTTKVVYPNLDNSTFDIAPNSLRMVVEPVQIGKAFLVWSQGAEGARSIYERHYGFANFNPITLLENQSNDAQFPQIALSGSNSCTIFGCTPWDAYAVWQQADGGGKSNSIYYSKYTASMGTWLPAGVKITAGNPVEAAYPNVVTMDSLGNAMAVWREKSSALATWQVYASRLTSASGNWGAPVDLCADTTNPADLSSAIAPGLVCQPNRNPVALWSQVGGSTFSLWANVFR